MEDNDLQIARRLHLELNGENVDRVLPSPTTQDDFTIAQQLHSQLNGEDSEQVLRVQLAFDSSSKKRNYAEVFADPEAALQQPAKKPKFYPWKVQRSTPLVAQKNVVVPAVQAPPPIQNLAAPAKAKKSVKVSQNLTKPAAIAPKHPVIVSTASSFQPSTVPALRATTPQISTASTITTSQPGPSKVIFVSSKTLKPGPSNHAFGRPAVLTPTSTAPGNSGINIQSVGANSTVIINSFIRPISCDNSLLQPSRLTDQTSSAPTTSTKPAIQTVTATGAVTNPLGARGISTITQAGSSNAVATNIQKANENIVRIGTEAAPSGARPGITIVRRVKACGTQRLAQTASAAASSRSVAGTSSTTVNQAASSQKGPTSSRAILTRATLRSQVKAMAAPANVPIKQEKVKSSSQTSKSNRKSSNIPKTLVPKRMSHEDFHVAALNGYILSTQLHDNWDLVDINPGVKTIWQLLRIHFLNDVVKIPQYTAEWEEFEDLTNFKIDENQKVVHFNTKTLPKCSRGRLLGVFIHALIHCTVYETSSPAEKLIDAHNSNFMEILKIFNEKWDLEIGTDHTFLRAEEEKPLHKCTGLHDSAPFFGIIKCDDDNLPRSKRTGKIHKLFEATRTVNGKLETHFLMHKKLQNPKPLHEDTGNRSAAGLNPRELLDITDEVDDGPKVQVLTQVIDVEDQEERHPERAGEAVAALQEALKDEKFETCPICDDRLEAIENFSDQTCFELSEHLDVCFGRE